MKSSAQCGVVKLLSEFYPLPQGNLGAGPGAKRCELEVPLKNKKWYKITRTRLQQRAANTPRKIQKSEISAHVGCHATRTAFWQSKAKYRNAKKEGWRSFCKKCALQSNRIREKQPSKNGPEKILRA